jgi:outer membrane receptor protein involved in Fe transport
VTESLTAQASARYTHQTHDLTGCLRDVGGGLASAFGFLSTIINGDPHVPAPGDPSYIPPGGCATLDDVTNYPVTVDKTLDEHNVSWRGGLSWKPGTDSLVYGNVTRGFKGGSFETLPAIRPDQFDPVPQEQVTAYEIGARSRLFGGMIDLSGAAFYYDYKNKQLLAYISDAFFGNLPGLVSVPKSRAAGVEADMTLRCVRYPIGTSLSVEPM